MFTHPISPAPEVTLLLEGQRSHMKEPQVKEAKPELELTGPLPILPLSSLPLVK